MEWWVKKHNKIGKEIEEYVIKGQLVPDELSIKIIEKRLNFIENLKIIAKNIHKTITIEENLDISYSYNKKENTS